MNVETREVNRSKTKMADCHYTMFLSQSVNPPKKMSIVVDKGFLSSPIAV